MKCGLLGRKLDHSYSPSIHALLGQYEYSLFETEPELLERFLKHGAWDGINVTIPYKQAVLEFLDELTPQARQLGAVNTVVRKAGRLIGDNTDLFGFETMLQRSGLSPAGKKCLVLGSGGASKVVQAVLDARGAEVIVISRSGENNYQNLSKHADASILVNTTPVGMYPETGISPVELDLFPQLEGVLDVIYNPSRTKLMMDAQQRELVTENGLSMLVAQAMKACQCFTGHTVSFDRFTQILETIGRQTENIVLIGMPSCGKSTVGRLLADMTGKTFVDTDLLIEKLAQKSIPQIFAEHGEDHFRRLETQVLEDCCKKSCQIIATGGGCVTQEQNAPLLRQNGRIFWLKRDLPLLSTEGRPHLTDLQQLYQRRKPLYERLADGIIDNNADAASAAEQILSL